MAKQDDQKDQVQITDAEREEFRDAFKLFDKDGDGVITVEEIFSVFQSLGFKQYTKSEVKKMVKAVDVDGNGTIDLDEFIGLLRSKKTGKYAHMTLEDELKQAFKVFDSDGNGSIDADELAVVMQALGEKLTKQDIEFMIRSVDIDGDKTIDFPEFRKMMQLAPIPQDTISKIKQ
mmetsp:Transcript_12665/g.11277  ORF Transcript_12665/g.11277 Transcript_12665/m.11277 type:complete len:175 (-) Transcript_12665:279-803(-)